MKIPNFKITSKYRIDWIGGGVSILVDRKLWSRPHPDLNVETEHFEHCVVELKTDTRNIFLVLGYRPPNSNVKKFLKEYNSVLGLLRKYKSHEIIIGLDHNLDLIKASTHPQTN